jgi:hypothetical protein
MAEAQDVVIELVIRATNTGPLDVGERDERLPPTGRRIESPQRAKRPKPKCFITST